MSTISNLTTPVLSKISRLIHLLYFSTTYGSPYTFRSLLHSLETWIVQLLTSWMNSGSPFLCH